MPQKLRCEVAEVLNHGEGVYSVFLKVDSPAPRFLPGQFLHLALDEYKPGDFWPDSHTFSCCLSCCGHAMPATLRQRCSKRAWVS